MFSKKLTRSKFPEFMAKQPPCLVGMEACGGSHYWARQLIALGHDVKLMTPQYVKPYVKRNKNDNNDAQACAEAVTRPSMHFVDLKTIEQQEIQQIHRIRRYYVKQQTALMNRIRGLLAEFGIVMRTGKCALIKTLQEITDVDSQALTPRSKRHFAKLYEELRHITDEVKSYTQELEEIAHSQPDCRHLMTIKGIGPVIATAIVAKMGENFIFKRGRDFASFLGITPGQNSSGGKQVLRGITKKGDRYLRALLIHGARSSVYASLKENAPQDSHSLWIARIAKERGFNKAVVAVANKHARIAWALLKHKKDFDPELAHAA